MTVRVSVVIPALNSAATLGSTLKGLRAQVNAPAFETIVVDNGSQDETLEIARAAGVRLESEPVRGPSAARNRGLAVAQGEIIAYLDSDTLPTRRWLAALVAPFSDPAVMLAGGYSVSAPPQTPAQRFAARHALHGLEYRTIRKIFPFVSSQNMAVRRTAALEIGGWAEELFTAEDVDFCWRIYRHFGCEPVRQAEAVLFHQERPTDQALFRQAAGWGEGMALIYQRYPEAARWGLAQWADLAWSQARREAAPLALQVLLAVGRTDPDELEYARYHRGWSRAYWGGFVRILRAQRRRAG
jgi:glycosyltransferase involved in cell wall biosynthesis